MSAKYGVLMGCRTIVDIWVHGVVKWPGEQLARGVEVAWMATVRHGGSVYWLVNLRVVPWGVRLVAGGWYLCMSLVSYWVKLIVEECFMCWM